MSTWCACMFFVFFFQAEDGIRDSSVTGVQTCALPISHANALDRFAQRAAVQGPSLIVVLVPHLSWEQTTPRPRRSSVHSSSSMQGDIPVTYLNLLVYFGALLLPARPILPHIHELPPEPSHPL